MRTATGPVILASAGRQRADLLRRLALIRLAGIGLSFLMVRLTVDPSPMAPGVLVTVTTLTILYTVPALFSRGLSERALNMLGVVSVAGDFVLTSTWVALTANDPFATDYVVYMIVALEAAVLYAEKGMAIFLGFFLLCFALIYYEKWVILHEVRQVGSAVFRFGIVTVMTLASGSLTSAIEKGRALAEVATSEALMESVRLEAVHQLARGLGSSLQVHEVLSRAEETLGQLFSGRWSGILLEDGAGMARLVASSREPEPFAIPMPPPERLPSVDETLVIDDIWASPLLDQMGVVPPESLRPYAAGVVVPLHVGGRRLGAIAVLGRAGERMGPEDVQVLESIAPQVSTALEHARLYEEARAQSLTDPLTHLPNRRAFDDRLAEELKRSQRHDRPLSLVLLDIDHFKVYNDAHGHTAGDDILRRLGSALQDRLLRQTDVAFRYGGEEFAVIMPEATAAQAEAVMARVHTMLAEEPMPLGEHQPGGFLTISAGISCRAHAGDDEVNLVESADLALFAAKQSGRNRTLVFESEMSASLTNWTRVLPGIIEAGSVHAVYQPIVRLEDGVVVAYEALARPDGRDAATNVEGMFAAAQRIGSLHDLDWLCFRACIGDAGELEPGQELFVNITLAALLDSTRDPEYVELALQAAGRSTREVVFEISEREAITDKQRLARILRSYRELGFRFALDDVGEGHSTFELLAAAEPEYVKIARSLVLDVEGMGSIGTIRALVEFARATGATVVAEGIEDNALGQRMRTLGVGLGQGYGLGRPAERSRGADTSHRSRGRRENLPEDPCSVAPHPEAVRPGHLANR
ncbi:MAG: hypothetical protein NVSMB17_13410 [Candidatus Dormibacteria bacterium]